MKKDARIEKIRASRKEEIGEGLLRFFLNSVRLQGIVFVLSQKDAKPISFNTDLVAEEVERAGLYWSPWYLTPEQAKPWLRMH